MEQQNVFEILSQVNVNDKAFLNFEPYSNRS